MQAYKKGIRVKHPGQPQWGVGQVLEDSAAGAVRVFFVGAGEKRISLDHARLDQVSGAEAADTHLDNLPSPERLVGRVYRTLPQSINLFLEMFPEGFYGDRYLTEERNYKIEAHELALDLLSESSLRKLIAASEFVEVGKRAMKIVNKTNLIFPNEKMALTDGLAGEPAGSAFARSLYALLWDEGGLEPRFARFCNVLEDLGAAKWTIASYFPYIVHPSKYMFVKPTITSNAADVCQFEINYRPQLNWLTYDLILKFSNHLEQQLARLKPRDMIDVQSFMWCIARI